MKNLTMLLSVVLAWSAQNASAHVENAKCPPMSGYPICRIYAQYPVPRSYELVRYTIKRDCKIVQEVVTEWNQAYWIAEKIAATGACTLINGPFPFSLEE